MNTKVQYADPQTKVKWRGYINPAKNEQFINEMCAEGWKLVKIEFQSCFTFVRCEPNEYICRSAFTIKSSGFFDRNKYVRLAEILTESGAEVIPQVNNMGSQFGIYAIRKTCYGPFEINTDIDSLIEEYRLRKNYQFSWSASWIAIAACFISLGSTGQTAMSFLSILYFIMAIIYAYPAIKYSRIIKRLKTERDIRE
jgi:hypothetical protein